MSRHLFRFGLTNAATGDRSTWTAAARAAESLGYSTFLLPDTLATASPLPALAAAAAATSSLHVGTWVLCDPMRNPAQLAWEAGTVHELFGPRFELGLGAGRPGAEADCSALGVPFGSPGERISHLAGTLERLRDTLGEAPIMVAAAGPRLLALAARTADIVAFGWPATTDAEQARARVDTLRAAAGDRADTIELAAGLIAVGEAEPPWLTRIGLSARALADNDAVTVTMGSPRQMSDQVHRFRDATGVSYLTVPAGSAETFAPVVAELAGR